MIIISKWDEYYNGLIAIPIRKPSKVHPLGHVYIGFLVVDNKKGGLDNKIGIETLKSYADILYHLFELYDDMIDIMGIDFDSIRE